MKKTSLIAALVAVAAFGTAFALGCGGEQTHTLYKVEGYDATCTAAGSVTYYKCYDEGCGKLFSDEKGKTEISQADTVIPALGHKTVAIGDAVPADCTEAGITAGQKCSVCGMLLEAQQQVDALGHKPVHNAEVAAGCETVGKKENWTCSVCHVEFLDEKCTVTTDDISIKPIGHDYGDWQQISGDRHQKVCANDPDHVITTPCSYGKISDFEDESGHFLTCSVCNGTSELKPHDIKYYIVGDEHLGECKECDYEIPATPHTDDHIIAEVTGSKLYGGRTVTASDFTVNAVCVCGHETPVDSGELTFEDAVLVDGQNTLSIAFGDLRATVTYDAPTEPTFTLTLEGATVGDGNTLQLKENAKITEEIVSTAGKTLLGYRCGLDVYFDLDDFVMPDADAVLTALYDEDTVMFAPANKAQSQFSAELYDHVVLDNGIIATEFVWDGSEGRLDMKYPHSGADTGTHKVNVYSPAHKRSLMLVYVVNDGAKDATIRYQAENYGVKGEIEIVAKAGQTTCVPFVYSSDGMSNTTFPTCDHRIELISERAEGETVTLRVYGKLIGTENNKVTGITATLGSYNDAIYLEEGDTINTDSISITASISGYGIPYYGPYTCNVENGTLYSSDVGELVIGALGQESKIVINGSWLHASIPSNPSNSSWISAQHIVSETTGLPATKITFKANTTAGKDTWTDPSPDKGVNDNYNTSMPMYKGSKRAVRVYVKNLSEQEIKIRIYWENYGDIGGPTITTAAGATAVGTALVGSSGQGFPTTGCRVQVNLLSDIGEADASVEVYWLYETYADEITGISMGTDGAHKTTFTVGETFSSLGLRLMPATTYGSYGNVRIVNVKTDLDGHTFTEDDIGEKTVTVTWNGYTTTYTVTVTAA